MERKYNKLSSYNDLGIVLSAEKTDSFLLVVHNLVIGRGYSFNLLNNFVRYLAHPPFVG